jgi:hypothetical protein
MNGSPLFMTVSYVILRCSQGQMRRVHAWANVTTVHHEHTLRDFPFIMELPGMAMCLYPFSFEIESAISMLAIYFANPYPTCRRLSDVRPIPSDIIPNYSFFHVQGFVMTPRLVSRASRRSTRLIIFDYSKENPRLVCAGAVENSLCPLLRKGHNLLVGPVDFADPSFGDADVRH